MSASVFVMCFPGQGSQAVGMLQTLAEQESSISECYTEASTILGVDLWRLICEGPAEKLQLTEYAQPALLVAGVALWRYWQAREGASPQWLAGHSLGECTALVCSGAMSFADGVSLVRHRGRLMQEAVPVGEGVMYAVLGLDTEEVERVCAQHHREDAIVQLVNYNAPGQMVIAGHKASTEAASEACLQAGARRSVALPVSAPFHTNLMLPMSGEFADILSGIELNTPKIDVIHNVHAQPEADPARIRDLLVRQLYSPVRWIDCIRYAVTHGANTAVECGPGKVLSGLNKRIDKQLNCYALDPADNFNATLSAVVA